MNKFETVVKNVVVGVFGYLIISFMCGCCIALGLIVIGGLLCIVIFPFALMFPSIVHNLESFDPHTAFLLFLQLNVVLGLAAGVYTIFRTPEECGFGDNVDLEGNE